ncbi:MAG: hypothetical protein RRZ92_04245 [Bacilli bacterium]
MKSKLLLILVSVFVLTGCGVNTLNWPIIDLTFASNEIVSITMNFICKDKENFTDKIEISEPKQMLEIYEAIVNIPIKENEENSIETKNYYIRLSIIFHLNDTKFSSYQLVYYEYNIADGKIMLDDGRVHWLPGNFLSLYYTNVKLRT